MKLGETNWTLEAGLNGKVTQFMLTTVKKASWTWSCCYVTSAPQILTRQRLQQYSNKCLHSFILESEQSDLISLTDV